MENRTDDLKGKPDGSTSSARLPDQEILVERTRVAREKIAQHVELIYRNINFSITLTTAILGGLGYLGLHNQREPNWWKVQKVAWCLWYSEIFVALLFGLLIVLHHFAIRRHWQTQYHMGVRKTETSLWRIFCGPEVYFLLSLIFLIFALKCYVVRPLFM